MLSGQPVLSPALIVAIVLGNTMTAVAVAARLALDTLKLRAGEVEAALSLGLSERDHESSGCRQNLGWLTICV